MDCQGTSCIPLSQSELNPAPAPVSWPAQRLLPRQRQELAIRALAGGQTISELARQHEVSRKFVYQQVAAAEVALDRAFAPRRGPTTSSSTCRSPRLGCGNWSWPWC